MPVDHGNPHIIAETSHRHGRHARDVPGKHSFGVMACAMLHATGRSREGWEDAIAIMEDDVQDSEGEKAGMGVNEVVKFHRRRGLVLEGTMVERGWRKREAGHERKAAVMRNEAER